MRGDLRLQNYVEAESFKPAYELFPGAFGASLVRSMARDRADDFIPVGRAFLCPPDVAYFLAAAKAA